MRLSKTTSASSGAPAETMGTIHGPAVLITEFVPHDILAGISSAFLNDSAAGFFVYERDGDPAFVSISPGWKGVEEAVRRRAALHAIAGAEAVEETAGGGVWSCTLPVPAPAGIAGAVRLETAAPSGQEEVRRQLRLCVRMLGTLIVSASRARGMEALGIALGSARTVVEAAAGIVANVREASGAVSALLTISHDHAPDEELTANCSAEAAARMRQLAAGCAGTGQPAFDQAYAAAAFPLRAGDRTMGSLALVFPSPGDAERSSAAALARTCAETLERLRVAAERDALAAKLAGEERLRAEIVNALPVSMAMFAGPRHVLEFSNPERVRLWGGRNHIGEPLAEAYPELSALAEAADRVYATGKPVRLQATPVRVAGTGGERFFDISVLPRRNDTGEIAGVMAFGVEATAQVQALREVEREHAFLEAVLGQMPSGVMIAEAPSGKLLLVNSEGEQILRSRFTAIDTIGDYRAFKALHPDGREYEPRELPLARSLATGQTVHQEDLVYRRGDGSTAVLAVNAAPIRDAEGRIVAAVCTFHDITERRKERDALRRQSRLIDLSRDAIITATAERRITGWNSGAEETYGWTAAEAEGKHTHALLRGGRGPEIDAALLRDGHWEGELLHTRKDGTQIVVESCHALVRDDRGRPAAFLEINRDITARKRAAEALRESVQWLHFCQQATGVGIGDFDLLSGRHKCSDQFYLLHGFEPDDPSFHFDSMTRHIRPEDRENVLARLDVARQGGEPFEAEYRVAAPDQPERWVGSKATLFFDDGRPVRAIAAAQDITERKRSEQAHHNAQKLESIGLLAGGIAHDFNNLLTGILGNASLLMPDFEGEAAERLEAIMSGAQKAADLTRLLLAYAGKGRFVIRELDLYDVVRDMTELVRVSVPKLVELRRDLHEARVSADSGQVQQVIMSLIMNATEAIGDRQKGAVTVSTGVERLTEPLVSATGETLPPGTYAYLEVADTGCGMDAATRARIFDPFFTTKFLGRGLGLAAVAGIIRSHKGGIRITTAPGEGSTFRVLLPAAQAAAEPDAKPGVLVVDDEETVRDFLKRVLQGRGFHVTCASDGREALEIIERAPTAIGLVILDAVMPVMSGGETLAAIRARYPGLKVLLTSGYSEDEVHRLFGVAGPADFIQKPYTAQQLADTVRNVLES